MGAYQRAHWHGPGAVLLRLRGEGYGLIWPRQYGIHPFLDGHGDKVIKFAVNPGSIYCVFDQAFHQHFNTGREPGRHLAMRGGGHGFDVVKEESDAGQTSVREGGRRIEYEDEDPEIRRIFEKELNKKGIECTMPPVVYRTDPFDPFKDYD